MARGKAHEAVVLQRFRVAGWGIAEIPEEAEPDAGWTAMLAAIHDGADVVYQGELLGDQGAGRPALLGRPDFLVRAGLLPHARW